MPQQVRIEDGGLLSLLHSPCRPPQSGASRPAMEWQPYGAASPAIKPSRSLYECMYKKRYPDVGFAQSSSFQARNIHTITLHVHRTAGDPSRCDKWPTLAARYSVRPHAHACMFSCLGALKQQVLTEAPSCKPRSRLADHSHEQHGSHRQHQGALPLWGCACPDEGA